MIFGFYLVSFAAMLLTALLFLNQLRSDEPFVVEIPPWRLPAIKQVWVRGWLEVRHFLSRATRFIVLGVIAIWLYESAAGVHGSLDSYAGELGHAFAPILAPIGIDEKLTLALLFGFIAKEVMIGAFAVIYEVFGRCIVTGIHAQYGLAACRQLHAIHAALYTLHLRHCHDQN